MLMASVAIFRETGLAYVGPMALSALARVAVSQAVREQAILEAENLLEAGTASFNVLYFYRDLMDISLDCGDHDRVERCARALEDFTRAQPLPWSRFFIQRARALSSHMRGARDPETLDSLRRLHAEARRVGFHLAARALEEALMAVG